MKKISLFIGIVVLTTLSFVVITKSVNAQQEFKLELKQERNVFLLEGKMGRNSISMILDIGEEKIIGKYYSQFDEANSGELVGNTTEEGIKIYCLSNGENSVDSTVFFILNKEFKGKWVSGRKKNKVNLSPANCLVNTFTISEHRSNNGIVYTNYDGLVDTIETDYEFELLELQTSSEIIEEINHTLNVENNQAVHEAESFHSELLKDIKTQGAGVPALSSNLTYSINYFDKNILSLRSKGYFYAGGAHGMPYFTNYVFDLRTGKKLSLENIIIDVENKDLVALLQKKLLEYTSGENYYWDFEKIRLADNFRIENNSIVFEYGSYEIAAYALGHPRAIFTFEELMPFVPKDSPIWYLFVDNKQ